MAHLYIVVKRPKATIYCVNLIFSTVTPMNAKEKISKNFLKIFFVI